MNPRLLLQALLLALLGLGTLLPARAADQLRYEGHNFDTRLRLADTDLLLNGVGLRAVAWFKGYAAGLYLPQRATTAAKVMADARPKRLQMRMMQDVPAAEFVKAFEKGVRRNTPAAELPTLAERMKQFDAIVQALGTVRKGDVVNLDFLPPRGLVLSLNGQPRGEPIAGDDLYDALLRIFIGDDPVDDKLKAGLLAGLPK